jgi:hypothetical protein
MLVLFVSKFAERLEAIDQTTSRGLNESKILIEILKEIGISVTDLYHKDAGGNPQVKNWKTVKELGEIIKQMHTIKGDSSLSFKEIVK